jgi:hypothetical protein
VYVSNRGGTGRYGVLPGSRKYGARAGRYGAGEARQDGQDGGHDTKNHRWKPQTGKSIIRVASSMFSYI